MHTGDQSLALVKEEDPREEVFKCCWKHQLETRCQRSHVTLVAAVQLRCLGDTEIGVFSVSFSLCVVSLLS